MELTEHLVLKVRLAKLENLELPDLLDPLALLDQVETVTFLGQFLTNLSLDLVDQQGPQDSQDKKATVVFLDQWDLMERWDLKELLELLDLKDLLDLEVKLDLEDRKVLSDRPAQKEILVNQVFLENRDDQAKRARLVKKVLMDLPVKTATRDLLEDQDQLVILDHLEFQENQV